jgi:hypothetical protein
MGGEWGQTLKWEGVQALRLYGARSIDVKCLNISMWVIIFLFDFIIK